MVIQLWLNPTGAEQGQVRSNMDNPRRAQDPCEPGQCPTPGESDAARGQVPNTERHGSVEGAPGPGGPGIWPLHHVSWGLKGLEQGPKDSGTGQLIDNGKGRISLHSLNLVLSLESSGWDGPKPRDHSLAFPLINTYCMTLDK